jgi:hypothetical protein
MNQLKRKLTTSLAVVAVVIGVFLMVSAALAENAVNTLGVSISPTNQTVDLKAGEVYQDHIIVRNYAAIDEKVIISAQPYNIVDSNYDNPRFDLETAYTYVAGWITFSENEFLLGAGEMKEVTYTVQVPESVPDGSQYATIFAESQPLEMAQGTGVSATARTGMILKVRMLDGQTRHEGKISRYDLSWFQPDGPLTASYTFDNTGNDDWSLSTTLTVSDFFTGKIVYQPEAAIISGVYPESSRSVTIQWDNARAGIYRAKLAVNKGTGSETEEFESIVVTLPIWVLILIGGGIVLLIIFIVTNVRLHRQNRRSHKHHKERDEA